MTSDRIPVWILVAGVELVLLALLLDPLYGGAQGFGSSQQLVAAIGSAIAAAGILLACPTAQRVFFKNSTASGSGHISGLVLVAAQLLILYYLFQYFEIESPIFRNEIIPIFLMGFLPHHVLAPRYRLPFFLSLSICTIVAVLGWGNGVWLVGLGTSLAAICHLPTSFAVRVGILVIAGIALALARAGVVPVPWSPPVWPILGSMFMFRLILYLYDLRHTTERANLWRTLSYFFLLPNVAFPLFPAIDFSTFRRTYYDEEAIQIYQKGARWILLGFVHLLMYRIVYQQAVIAPSEVTSAASFARHVVANFGLYLRVAGQFHLIVGILHLFGFRLPETNRFFFIASSFTDFWRRINIYWKDFMLKVFQYPLYFRLRRRDEATAIVLATLAVFAATWALHSYQWFWLLGEVLVSTTDILFWAALAAILVANVLYELKHGRRRTLSKPRPSLRGHALLALQTASTFTVIALLWSLWTSPSLRGWLALWAGTGADAADWGKAVALVFAVGVVVAITLRALERVADSFRPTLDQTPWKTFTLVGLTALIAVVSTQPRVSRPLGDHIGLALGDLRRSELNRVDAATLRRGYYENLTGFGRVGSQLAELYARRPETWKSIEETELGQLTNDVRWLVLRPSVSAIFHAAPYTTNKWAMRDKDYDSLPPPGIYRVALIGSSQVDGWGVGDGENFESLVEQRLNTEMSTTLGRKVEILNFAVGGYTPVQELVAVEQKALQFRPNALYYVAHPVEMERTVNTMARLAQEGIHIPFPYLAGIVEQSGVKPSGSRIEGVRQLEPYRESMIAWIYERIVAAASAQDVLPVWILLPMEPGSRTPGTEDIPTLLRIADEAGFVIVDLQHVYQGHEIESLQTAPWDYHPNRKAHRIIADSLYQRILTDSLLMALPSPATRGPAAPGGR